MKESSASGTRISVLLDAPRERVYNALIDPLSVSEWMVPDGMTSEIHVFEAWEGGAFRISLTYDEPTGAGKTSSHTDTYHGVFITLKPGRKVVQNLEFETTNPLVQGEMTITFTLAEVGGRTELVAIHDGLPAGISAEDNEAGWRMSLMKLARLVSQVRDPERRCLTERCR